MREDVDGSKHVETWFVECKHYRKGVPPDPQRDHAWAPVDENAARAYCAAAEPVIVHLRPK